MNLIKNAISLAQRNLAGRRLVSARHLWYRHQLSLPFSTACKLLTELSRSSLPLFLPLNRVNDLSDALLEIFLLFLFLLLLLDLHSIEQLLLSRVLS